MLNHKTIAFIGSGVMAEAMIKGLLREALVTPAHIVASGPRPGRGQELFDRYGVCTTTDNAEAAQGAEVVVLSVKPQVLCRVLENLVGHVSSEALVLSIVAGAAMSTIGRMLRVPAVVRVMPNTPAQIGLGISVWTATEATTEEQSEQALSILRALGEEVYVDDERYLDMATALSGTGPAYVFLLMEAMVDAGVHLGFSRHVSERLVIETLRGSVEYAQVAQASGSAAQPGYVARRYICGGPLPPGEGRPADSPITGYLGCLSALTGAGQPGTGRRKECVGTRFRSRSSRRSWPLS
jgi:pyrroline-5-carboxylate reductase